MDPYRNGSINGTLDDYENQIQKKLAAPMPWIGFYIVAASFICSMAMGVDLMVSLVSKRYWFPCITCSLNATYLTLLAVSSKLAVDLSSSMLGVDDKLAKVSRSLVFMSTAMCNSMPSLASMDNNELLSNLTALGILVFTIAVNVFIYDAETSGFVDGRVVLAEETVATVFMLLSFVILCCSSVVVPTIKKYTESKYREMNQTVQVEGNGIPKCRLTVDELRLMIQQYWVMAETGNPQFVMARSVISATSGMLCLLMVFTLLEAHLRLIFFNSRFGRTRSDYGLSTRVILYIQSAGVFLGSIAPLFRWYFAAQFRISEMSLKSLRGELKIEGYWTLRLVERRESPLTSRIWPLKMRKLIYHAKRLLLNICIRVQILVVLTSNLILFISSISGNAIFFCFRYINILKRPDPQVMRLDLSRYVLLLEGEAELPNKILTHMCYWDDNLIKFGRRHQSKNLAKLLHMSENFDGVMKFDDNKEVGSLHSQEPPNCWSWPVVTLASIAIALPNITRHKFNEFLRAVSEGMCFVNLIEESLDGRDGGLDSIAKAAHGVWERVLLHHKWLDKNIQETNQNGQTYKHVLQELSHIAKKTVEDFKTRIEDDVLMRNPQNWPVKVIAANSMYRITQTMLLAYKDEDQETDDEEIFRRLSVMISDIFAACLTNLVHFIRLQCHSNVIKERMKRVSFAAIVLGESEEILEILQQRVLPDFCLDPAKAANIEEWRRALTELDNELSVPQPNGEYVSIELRG